MTLEQINRTEALLENFINDTHDSMKERLNEVLFMLNLDREDLLVVMRENIKARGWLYDAFQGVRFKNPLLAFDTMSDTSYNVLKMIIVRKSENDNSQAWTIITDFEDV